MVKIRLTWLGPSDKLLVNGKSFHSQFIDVAKYSEYILGLPGIVSVSYPQELINGTLVREFVFDNEAHALAARIGIPNTNEISYFNDQAGHTKYIQDNNITWTVEVLPA